MFRGKPNVTNVYTCFFVPRLNKSGVFVAGRLCTYLLHPEETWSNVPKQQYLTPSDEDRCFACTRVERKGGIGGVFSWLQSPTSPLKAKSNRLLVLSG